MTEMCPPKRGKSSLNNTASQQFHLGPPIGTSLTTTNPILLISKESGANFVLTTYLLLTNVEEEMFSEVASS